MSRVSLVVLLGAAGAACSDPVTTTATQLNLDRPVDISFACYGAMRLADGSVVATAQPTVSCEVRSPQLDPKLKTPVGPDPTPVGQEGLKPPAWYGFILQSAPGTVALARWPTGPVQSYPNEFYTGPSPDFAVIDTDPRIPSKNAISIGEEPIAIATDRAGCFEVTANAGSCDLSTLEISSAVDGDATTPTVVKRVQVKTASGEPFLARPAAMLAEPNITQLGNSCPATATGLVYVAYPSCHLVAAIDVASERIVAGIQFDSTGAATVTDGNVPVIRNVPTI
jgi:hypothetical protein